MPPAEFKNPHKSPEPPESEYPTGEAPVYELDPPPTEFEYKGAEYTSVYHDDDPNGPHNDVFAQLERAAAERGNPGMVGLEWLEADGMRYRVSSHERIRRPSKDTKKIIWPRISKPSIHGPEIVPRRKEVPTGEMVEEDYRTVDVIGPDGDIVDILVFDGTERRPVPRTAYGPFKANTGVTGRPVKAKEYRDVDLFQDHFSVSVVSNPNAVDRGLRKSRDVVGFRWTEQPPKPEIKRVGRVPAPHIEAREHRRPELMSPEERNQKLLEALAEQQAALGLHDWRSLTWIDPATKRVLETDEDGNMRWSVQNYGQSRIIRDEIVMKKDEVSGEVYVERVFEVRTTSADGNTLGRRLYTMNELWELFKDKEAADRKIERTRTKAARKGVNPALIPPPVPLGLHWDTGQPLAHAEPERQPEPYLGLEDALALLIGSGEEALQKELTPKDITPEAFAAMSNEERAMAGRTALSRLVDHTMHSRDNKALSKTERRREHTSFKVRLQERAKELLRVIDEIGSDRLFNVVHEIQEAYEQDLVDLGRLGIKEDSLPDAYFQQMKGSEILNNLMERSLHDEDGLFDDDPEGKARRLLPAEREFGWVFVHSALNKTPGGRKRGADGGDDEKVFVRTGNQDVMGRIRNLLYKKAIEELLDKEKENTNDKSILHTEEFVAIGHMLRGSMGRN